MEQIQDQNGHHDHGALEPDEEMLVLDQSSCPALTQFGDAVDRADENAKSRQRQRDQEDPELGAASQRRVFRIQGRIAHRLHPPECLDCEIHTQQLEYEQREDLEGQSRDHDVIAGIGALVLVAGCGCHAAADCLEQEGDDVARDEDARVGEGFDVRVFGAKGRDDAGEGEVDAGREEGWSDGQADDLHEETGL